MLRKAIIVLCSLGMLAATLAAPAAPVAQAQGDPGLRLISEFILPGSRDVKFPRVVAGRDLVNISGNANRDAAFVWSKRASATGFPNALTLGSADAEGLPDWSSTSIALGPDGSLYAAWVNMPARTISLRRRDPSGNWGPTRIVDRGSNFPVNVDITVSSNSQIFVAWRDPNRPIRFRTSEDDGVNWSNRRDVSDRVAFASPSSMAAGPNGQVGITFTAGEGDRLQIYVGLWNGSAFTVQRATAVGADYADSSISFGPNGQIYAAWRGVADGGGNAGVFYAERQSDGNWPRSRLVGGKVTGTVSLNADEQGNLHVSWIGQPSGGNQVFYAFKPATGNFRGPVASGDRGALFNPRGYGSTSDGVFNHIVSEEFSGSVLNTRYSLFQAEGVTFGGEPVVESGIGRARRNEDGAVQLTFSNVRGTPTQVRWNWDAPPSDANPWVDYGSGQLRIPVPTEILNSTSCQPSTLYTQLRSGEGVVENQARSVTVQVDGVVEAYAYLENPFSKTANPADLAGVQGAAGGAPGYTRLPLVYLNVVAESDCNGLTTLSVGASQAAMERTLQINDSGFSGIVPLPNLANLRPGPVPFVVRVTDGAGNNRFFDFNVILDETNPVLVSPGQASIRPNREGDLFQDITIRNPNITDNLYRDTVEPGRQFWGYWIANAVEPTNPLTDQTLRWNVVEAEESVADPAQPNDRLFTINGWSLATGLTREQLIAGEDYFVYIRFLDGAGNPTDGFVELEVPRSNVVRDDYYLPILVR